MAIQAKGNAIQVYDTSVGRFISVAFCDTDERALTIVEALKALRFLADTNKNWISYRAAYTAHEVGIALSKLGL